MKTADAHLRFQGKEEMDKLHPQGAFYPAAHIIRHCKASNLIIYQLI